MATYKGIQGYSVQSLSSDPTASSATTGQLWYNSDSGKFKIVEEGAGAWAAGGDFNRSNNWNSGSCGTQTAGLVAAGSVEPGIETETYDGSTWTEVGDCNTARYGNGGAGSTTAAITFAGALLPAGTVYTGVTESYNGTAWTEVGDLNTARHYVASTNYAPATAALCLGGNDSPPPNTSFKTESYNGTSWTELADINVGRYGPGGAGTTTAALFFGGKISPGSSQVASTETFNGTTWTEVGDLNTAKMNLGAAGSSNTAALCYGGQESTTVFSALNESWNGTSWTELTALGTARKFTSNVGTSSVALAGGGDNSVGFTGTEEWNDPVYSVKTVTVS